MIIFWACIAAAMVLGAVPAKSFWGRGILLLDGEQLRARFCVVNPGDNRKHRKWWKSSSFWFEPLRGMLIGWLVARGLRFEGVELERTTYLALKFGAHALLLMIVLWQTCGREKMQQTLVPLLFIGGMLVGGVNGLIGLSATLVAVLALFATQSLVLAIWALSLTTFGAGWFLIGAGPNLVAALGICALPWLKAFILRHTLVIALRG